MTAERKLITTTLTLTAGLIGLAIFRWTDVRLGDGELGPYDFFPLLGLVAFLLMWSHYVSGSLQRLFKAKEGTLRSYFTVTGWVVLLLILLHPGIFVLTLWQDGLGIPPDSYFAVYADAASRIAILVAYLSLFAFLAYEFHRKFKQKSWWRFVEYANVAAMFGIFFHALTLGGEIHEWFRIFWIILGIVLAASITYNYIQQHKETSRA